MILQHYFRIEGIQKLRDYRSAAADVKSEKPT